MKVITAAIAALFNDNNAKAKIIDLFAAIPQTSTAGGMTIGIGNNRPIVVCTGKPSLSDEKSLRAELRKIDEKIKLSRTNDVDLRCEQYDIAPDATTWKKLAGKDAKEKAEKKTSAVETPETSTPAETPVVSA